MASENARLVGCPKQFEANMGLVFVTFDHQVAQTTVQYLYILRFGDFCVHNDDDDNDSDNNRTDYFIAPCAQGNKEERFSTS